MQLETIETAPQMDAGAFDLRALKASDAGLMTLYCSDLRISGKTTSIPHPLPPGAAEAFIERARQADDPEDVWAMDASRFGGAELMGLISLERMEGSQSEIGYWVAPAFWNTGVASAAVAALLKANPQKARTIFASVFQDNPVSARVLTNCGFDYVGDAESYSVARASKVPTWTYLYHCSG
ncbi:MAG: GNAT family N-acetyltransferase [Pseudomonadota bacterium]